MCEKTILLEELFVACASVSRGKLLKIFSRNIFAVGNSQTTNKMLIMLQIAHHYLYTEVKA